MKPKVDMFKFCGFGFYKIIIHMQDNMQDKYNFIVPLVVDKNESHKPV